MPITSAPVSPIFAAGAGLAEQPDSDIVVLDYKWKLTKKYAGQFATIDANAAAGYYFRGVTQVIGGYTWVIAQARYHKVKPQVGFLEIDYENISGQVSPDEWQIQRENLQPHIERHPIFQALSTGDFATVQMAFAALTATGQATAKNQFYGSPNQALMQKLFDKLKHGFETYYLAGSRYTWSTYYLPGSAPGLAAGGVTQTPGGPAGAILPAGNEYLREADVLGQANYSPIGGIEKLERNWVGGPNGWWDPDIYPAG